MTDKPNQIVIFYCSNSLESNAIKQGFRDMETDELTLVSLPCSGKANLLYLLKPFEKGSAGVILVTCSEGNCKFLEGNLRAQKRSEAVDAILEETGLGKGRMRIVRQTGDSGVEQLISEVERLREIIRNSS